MLFRSVSQSRYRYMFPSHDNGGFGTIQTPGPATLPNSLRWFNTALVADLTDATAATINDLRLALQTQKLYERDARGGTRYTEVIKSHFGVTSPDMCA